MWSLAFVGVAVAFLFWERWRVDCALRRVPLRVVVTGSRGKSTVTRLIAAALSEGGRRVLAKTTGSEARLLLPDGRIRPVPRRGLPSILEQKRVVSLAARLKVDCLVAEIMSVHRENHVVESRRLLRPHVVVVTNVRVDHCSAMGETVDEIASVLAETISPGCTVLVPAAELRRPLEVAARDRGATLQVVAPRSRRALGGGTRLSRYPQDLDLVTAVTELLGAAPAATALGTVAGAADLGELQSLRYRCRGGRILDVVNAFAANDPTSTRAALDEIGSLLPSPGRRRVGLLNLRWDRADRSHQWLLALRGEARGWFETLFVVGGHARALRRALGWPRVLGSGDPEELMEEIAGATADGDIVVGLGNIGGMGRRLVEHWRARGERHEP